MKLEEARRYALSLPEAAEAPHFHFASFRIHGKIFATVPPDEAYLHVFVPEEEREVAIAADPQAYEKLWWGKKVVGVRVTLAKAKRADVEQMLRSAWMEKAPKKLAETLGGTTRG